jgi:hypothetical protein
MSSEELEAFFRVTTLPCEVEMFTGVVIKDVPLFLESHFNYVNDNPGLKSIEPFLQRLHHLHNLLTDSI